MGEQLVSDDTWRAAVWVALALLVVAYLVGGLVTRVAGAWRQADGAVLHLHQAGPWVWGESAPAGGHQIYRGRAVWGRVRLGRRDHGAAHLRSLGFDDEQATLVAGRQTGILRLRQQGGELVGDFVGFAFSFDAGRIRSSRPAAPSPRRFIRG